MTNGLSDNRAHLNYRSPSEGRDTVRINAGDLYGNGAHEDSKAPSEGRDTVRINAGDLHGNGAHEDSRSPSEGRDTARIKAGDLHGNGARAYHSAVFIDLDGTLVERSGNIPASAIEAIKKAQSMGFMIVITTGRMYRSARKETARIGVGGDSAIIAYNGAFAASSGDIRDVYHFSPLPAPEYEAVLDIVLPFCDRGVTVFCYSDDELYVDREGELLKEYVGRTGAIYKVTDDFRKISGAPKVLALTYFDKPELLKPVHAKIDSAMKGRIEYAFSFPNYLELTKLGVTKGAAIPGVLERKGIPPERTFAIGDSFNDIPMFRACAVSVAMGGADEEVRKSATRVTAPIEKDGLAEAFENFILRQ